MAKLPLLSARELNKILEKLGFKFIRQEGSHMFFEHPNGKTTVVPNHPSEDIGRGLSKKQCAEHLFLGCSEIKPVKL